MFDEDSPITTTPHARVSHQSWGIAALAIGCTLLLSACVLMVFNVLLFRGGLIGIPLWLAQIAGVIGMLGVAIMGAISVSFGIRGWNGSASIGESTGFGVAGTLTTVVGLIAWSIAALDLLAILRLFV